MSGSWKDVFHSFNKKATPSRYAIVKVFEERAKHLSAEEVYECLKIRKQKISIATVYRNLDLLLRMGILRKVNFGDGKEHYEMVHRPTQYHHHLICTNCGRVIDYGEVVQEERSFLERLKEELEKKYHFRIESHQIYFYGLCHHCQKG
ncbi:MAG: Fur family transcriptional regulator [Candidatus Caldatribacteriaceae bacterium]